LCRRYSAQEAYEMGWINKVVPDDELEAEVERWCEELMSMSARYMEVAKASSNVMYNQMRDNMVQSLGALIQAIGSPDMREGAAAFMEKRKPQFPPRSAL
jgi:2-ketocyclohexanecarboxyl-CoA hydrolase